MKTALSVLVTRHRWHAAWGVVVVLAAAVGVRWWIGTVPTPGPLPAPASVAPATQATSEAAIPFVEVEGSRLAGVDPTGKKLWELRAKTVQIDRDKDTVTFTDVGGQLYQNGVPQFTFVAPRGVLFIASRDVELTGGVSGRANGRTLRAPQVRWDAAHQQLIATGGITLTDPRMVVSADKVVTDPALRRTTFTGNIRVRVTQ